MAMDGSGLRSESALGPFLKELHRSLICLLGMLYDMLAMSSDMLIMWGNIHYLTFTSKI